MYIQMTWIVYNPPCRYLLTRYIYMGKDIDKQDKKTTLISGYGLYLEYMGRMFWCHIKLLWGPEVAI